MGENYAECRKTHKDLDGKIDGCQEFLGLGWASHCSVCGCHMNYHRKVKVVKYVMEVVYTECHKTHHDHRGSTYKDGCKEFAPGVCRDICDACSCHKSFHRNEVKKEVE